MRRYLAYLPFLLLALLGMAAVAVWKLLAWLMG